jgi:hypothetical protein
MDFKINSGLFIGERSVTISCKLELIKNKTMLHINQILYFGIKQNDQF